MRYLKKVFHPEYFQGRKKKKKYFEGWYFKQVTSDRKSSIAFIPGVSIGNDTHAFVQVLVSFGDAKKEIITHYFRFPISEFSYSDSKFSVQIGNSVFSKTNINIDLQDEDVKIFGSLEFFDLMPIKTGFFSPSIMGFFGYFPFLECYHGVISMNHQVCGKIRWNDEEYEFQNGQGYIEKDWGRSFPESYLWIQCNNFQSPSVSLMVSIAKVPFLGMKFSGLIANLQIEDSEYRFATYNGGKVLFYEVDDKDVLLILKRKHWLLQIEAHIAADASLVAPKSGRMNHSIKEGLGGTASILLSKKGKLIYQDYGTNAGIEIVKKLEEL